MLSRMPNTGVAIKLQAAERAQLQQWESSHGTPQQVALRCRTILAVLGGQGKSSGTRGSIIEGTLHSKPAGMTHWSCRLMAQAQDVSKSTVNRLWQLHNIKPHLSGTFKLSRDVKFLECRPACATVAP